MSSRAIVLAIAALAVAAASPLRGAGEYPEAVSWGPIGDNAALDGPIVVTWTTRMDPASVEAAFTLYEGTFWRDASDFQWVHSTSPPWTTRAMPLRPLASSTVYVATFLPTATDASGRHALDQDGDGVGGEPTDALAWSFRTEDGTPPRVLATAPADGAVDVPVATQISLVFDEPMDRASVESAFAIDPATAGSFTWDANGVQATFVPDLLLFPGSTYAAVLRGDIAKDAHGASLDGDGDGVGGDDYRFAFATAADPSPPTVLAVTPLAGSGNVSVTTRITIRFSEAMNRSSVEAAFSYGNGTATWDGSAGAFAWTGSTYPDDVVTFNPDENLPFSDAIAVRLNASLARDRSGAPLDGDGDGVGGDDVAWNFTTEVSDRTKPRVQSTDPADGATGVLETATIRIAFTERMDRASVEDAFLLQDPVRTWTKMDGWFSWARGDEEVVFAPSTNLLYDAEHTLAIRGTARDGNGNPLEGGGPGGNFTATFRTRPRPDETPPYVVATVPRDGATGVARSALITITFDDAMSRDATERAIGLAAETTADPEPVPIGGFEWAAEDHAVSFRPLAGPLDWERNYTVTVGLAARDDAGNPLAAAFSFSFRTEAWSGRVIGQVVSGGPVGGATIQLGNQTTQSAPNGTFGFPAVRAGTYELTISKAGYQTHRRTVTIDHRMASPDFTTVDLGVFPLTPEEGWAVAAIAVLGATVAGVLAVGLLLRRRRPPEAHFEGWAEEEGEALR